MVHKISQKNLEYVKQHYQTMSNRQIAEILKLDKKDIARALKILNVQRTKDQERRLKNAASAPAATETAAVRPQQPAVDIASSEKKLRHFIFIGILILITFIVYADSFKNDFVWDDEILVERNVFIRDWKFLPNMFTDNTFRGGDRDSNFWRPIQLISYGLDYHLGGGLKPFMFHFTNTSFHALVVIMVYLVLFQIFGNDKLAFMTALLFGVHPLHTEAVTYIAGRADSQALFFMLLSLSLYIQFRKNKTYLRIFIFIGSLLSMVLGLMSKEMAFMTPAMFAIYDITKFQWPRRKVPATNTAPHDVTNSKNRILPATIDIILRYAPFIMLVITYGAYRSSYLDFTTGAIVEDNFAKYINVSLRLMTFCKTLVISNILRVPHFRIELGYIPLLLLPFNLHMERGTPYCKTYSEPMALFSFAIVAFLLYMTYYTYKKNRMLFFGLFWFFILIIPFSDIKPLNANMAEHWIYMPSIGLFFVASYFFYRLLHMENAHFTSDILKRIFISPFIIILIFYSFISIFRNLDWADDFTIWKRTADLSNSSHIHGNLGVAYGRRASMNFNGWTKQKIAKFAKQNNIAVQPNMHIQKMVPFLRDKLYEKAENEFKHAIRLQFNYPEAHNNLGVLMLRRNDLDAAEREFQLAIKFNPGYANAHKNLGDTYERKKEIPKAIEEWAIAVQINPFHNEAKQKLQKYQ